MRRIKEVIVVEGRYDKNALRQVVDAAVIETRGFGVFNDKELQALLRRLAAEKGLILLTDSDGAGFVIRNFLKGAIPAGRVKQAYIPDILGKERRKTAPGKEGKLGVEGMSPSILLEALERAGATFEDAAGPAAAAGTPLTKADFYALGLSGGADSGALRAALLKRLGLPERMSANGMLEAVNLLYGRDGFLEKFSDFRLAELFEGWEETMVWSCLQGVMGRGEVSADGTSGLIVNRDFSFLAGRPDRELVERAPGPLIVPRTEDWCPVIEDALGERAARITRYAVRKEPDVFDRKRLEEFARALPAGYELRVMDEAMVPVLRAEEWSRDLCSAFDDPAVCCRRGVGVAALYEGVPVAGAGSYSVYRGGIEVEIDTRPDHRRRGLATACGAALILACLDRGLYPSWDAATLHSAALAEKLGYHPGEPYGAYELRG